MRNNRTPHALALVLAAALASAALAQAPVAPPAAPAGSVEAVQARAKADAAAAAAAAEPPTDAEKALDEAITKLAALRSVSADLTETVDMLEQKFTVRGRYRKAPDRRVYLQLKVTGLADAAAQMLQVCDGQTLWDYQQVLENQSYSRVEVAPILEKIKAPELDDLVRETIRKQLGFAGPDELLRGLRKAVKFSDKAAETLDGLPVWRLHGVWVSRDGLLGPNQQPLPLTLPLPAYVPNDVNVWIGQQDGWPYKVQLVGRRPSTLIDARKVGVDGKRIGSLGSVQDVKPTDITIVYSAVKFNPDLKADEFAFTPPQNARVTDRTQDYVAMLNQAIQYRIAQKKADAAKADDPLLKQSIDLPKLAPSPAPSALPPTDGAPAATPGK